LKEENKTIGEKLRYSNYQLENEKSMYRSLKSDYEDAKAKIEKHKSVIKDIVKLADILPQNMIDSFRTLLPALYKAGSYAQQFQQRERKDRNAQRGFEI